MVIKTKKHKCMNGMEIFYKTFDKIDMYLTLFFIFISLIGSASHPDKAPAAVMAMQHAFAGISRHTKF